MTASAAASAGTNSTASSAIPSKVKVTPIASSPSTTTAPHYALHGPPSPTSLPALLKRQFERCRRSGTIRNDPLAADVLRRRIVPGQFGLLTEHEPSLFALKRPATVPARVDMAEPFDANRFHFNRVKGDEEVLAVVDDGEPGGHGHHHHRILVNVSPLMFGHGLLIPHAEQCLPQQLTLGAIDLAVRLLRRDIVDHHAAIMGDGESNNNNSRRKNHPSSDQFCVGFNSLGAFSSVNHQHLHVLYPSELDHEARGGERLFPAGRTNFPIAYAPVGRNVTPSYRGGPCRVDELHWTVPCFSFRATNNESGEEDDDENDVEDDGDEGLSQAVTSFVRYLHERRIPHNVLFVQEDVSDNADDANSAASTGSRTIRCIVIPRQHQDHFDKDRHGFNAALGEISGMLIARTREHFDAFQEEEIVEQLQMYVACGPNDLKEIYEELQQ